MKSLLRQGCAVSLTGLLLGGSIFVPAWSDSILVPRLGYPTHLPVRVYLDTRQSDNTPSEKDSTGFWQRLKGNHPKTDDKVAETGKADKKGLSREEKRRRTQDEVYARAKARKLAKEEEKAKKPVDGDFYLYNLKLDRLMVSTPGELREEQNPQAAAKRYVEFSEKPVEGLYDLAIRGSGHRSQASLWVSDSVYWDAMQPLLQGFSKYHCPNSQNAVAIMQHCYRLNVRQPGNTTKTSLVEGGWYLQNTQQESGEIKNTREIASLAQMLMQLYAINPESYKFVMMKGANYAQSRYPDILDEANWGLQYLLTVQQPDGSFPENIIKTGTAQLHSGYSFGNPSPEASAYAVSALATAVEVFKKEDLSLAVKYLRTAEKGWRYVQAHSDAISDEGMLLASAALMRAGSNPEYAQVFQTVQARTGKVSPQTRLMLPAAIPGMLPETATLDTYSKQISDALPLTAALQQHQMQAAVPLSQWVTNLYGYASVPLLPDDALTISSPKWDPLQWAATKTGDLASRLSTKMTDSGIAASGVKADPEVLKKLETRQKEAQARLAESERQITLTPLERANLVYLLGLLNQETGAAEAMAEEENEKKRPRPSGNPDPKHPVRGYFPKMI